VVTDGPYRLLRHPAYAGNLLAALGFGLALTNWAGLALAAGVPLLGHLPRIRVEERAMAGALGTEWLSYAAGTARIVPGVW
jgi:protein-S-isoprenylcysteine O-methyltransferase